MRITIEYDEAIPKVVVMDCVNATIYRAQLYSVEPCDTVFKGIRVTNDTYTESVAVTVNNKPGEIAYSLSIVNTTSMKIEQYGKITTILGDCMDYMATLPDNAFDLAIVDPPYGIGNFVPQNKSTNGKKISPKVEWNDNIPPELYFKELKRISKDQIIWGANYYNCFPYIGGALVWDKGEGNPIFSRCEIASLSFQKRVDYVHINWQSGFYRQSKEDIIHPCQKPAPLYRWMLDKYAKPHNTIFDTHGGSMSSAIACHDMGFEMTIIEKDEEYYNAAIKRLRAHQLTQTLDFGDVK